MRKKLLLIPVLIFIFYLFLYQTTINARVKLEDEHCLRINPLISQRKLAYIDAIRQMMDPENKKNYYQLNEEYRKITGDYLREEEQWLARDQAMLDNPLMKLLVNKNGYRGALLLHRIYELDYLSSKIILQMFAKLDKETELKLTKELVKNTDEQLKKEKEYDRLADLTEYRWVDYLIRVPPSRCPQENRNIPDVDTELERLFEFPPVDQGADRV